MFPRNWRTVVACVAALGGTGGSVRAQQPALTPKAQIGRLLFHDSRVSVDNTTSCASCHSRKHGFSDGRTLAIGLIGSQQAPNGFKGTRHSPSVLNVSLNATVNKQPKVFWDLRAKSTEDQSTMPMANPLEMGQQSEQQVANRIGQIQGYRARMMGVYGDGNVTKGRMAECLAAYEGEALIATDTPLRRYLEGKDANALPTKGAKRGAYLFFKNCMECHKLPLFTDAQAANNGVAAVSGGTDIGLEKTTGNRADRGKFKTPSLIAVAMREPLMHDGSMTRDRALAHYAGGGAFTASDGRILQDSNIDPRVAKISLTVQDMADLKEATGTGLIPFDYPSASIVPTAKEMPQ